MRITKEELEYSDITWFAVDRQGKIIEFTSAGSGYVPEFICESKENVNILEDFFENKASTNFIGFSEKRLYYFDANDGKNRITNYIKKSSPSNPILISQLPKHISDILSNNRLDIDAEFVDSIIVEPAYKTEISLNHFVSLIIKGQFNLNIKNRYFSIDFKTKLKLRKIMNLFKNDSNTSFVQGKSITEVVDKIENFKNYYEITTSNEIFVLYLVYKSDTVFYDKGGLYSIQISKKDKALFDFNDKAGVWIEC